MCSSALFLGIIFYVDHTTQKKKKIVIDFHFKIVDIYWLPRSRVGNFRLFHHLGKIYWCSVKMARVL